MSNCFFDTSKLFQRWQLKYTARLQTALKSTIDLCTSVVHTLHFKQHNAMDFRIIIMLPLGTMNVSSGTTRRREKRGKWCRHLCSWFIWKDSRDVEGLVLSFYTRKVLSFNLPAIWGLSVWAFHVLPFAFMILCCYNWALAYFLQDHSVISCCFPCQQTWHDLKIYILYKR